MNRKPLTSLLVVGLALVFATQPLRAATFGLFTYTDNGTGSNTVKIIGYPTSATGNVVIPSSIAGKPVAGIGDYAFYNCTSITSVTIPTSITSIGNESFYDCTSMTHVTIPASVTSMGVGVFTYCTSLASVTIPASVTSIGDNAFQYCSSLASVTIDASITSIGTSVFNDCTSLTSVTIPAGVTSIGNQAFSNCTKLTSVTIPTGITSIATDAFAYCTSLTNVTIPASVISIGAYAFAYDTKLTRATFLGNAPTTMGAFVFVSAASNFTVRFITGKTGFTTPTWQGYPCKGVAAVPATDVQCPLGTHLVSGTSKKSFGTVKVGVASAARYFTITNTGTANLTGLAVTKDGANPANFPNTQPTITTLAPGASATFTVKFKPTTTGTRTATIHINSNATTNNPFNITLAGMGS